MSKLFYEKVSEKELHPYEVKGVYANFFDILNKTKLETFERELSSVRQAELISDVSTIASISIPESLYSFKTYTLIHKQLFSDLYPWAGKIRGFDMGYDGHYFTNANDLVFYGEQVFDTFKDKVSHGFERREDFVRESACFLNLMNTLHPFPDGNG